MSDISQGPGWWIASDHKWYPPELHPSVRFEPSSPLPSAQASPTMRPNPQSSFAEFTMADRPKRSLTPRPQDIRGPSRGSVLLGGFGSRATAYILDIIVSVLWTWVILFLAIILPRPIGAFVALSLAVVYNLWYHLWRLATCGQTWGMKKVDLTLVEKSTGMYPVGLLRALLRTLVAVVFVLVPFTIFLDLLWPLWDPWNQTLHDKAASTLVTRRI